VAAILGLMPTEPLNGPPRDPNAPVEPSDDGVAVWDVEMGSDVVQ